MRDNTKGGALTEVTFYILLSLYTPKHGYAVMQFIEEKTGGRLSLELPKIRQRDQCSLMPEELLQRQIKEMLDNKQKV